MLHNFLILNSLLIILIIFALVYNEKLSISRESIIKAFTHK